MLKMKKKMILKNLLLSRIYLSKKKLPTIVSYLPTGCLRIYLPLSSDLPTVVSEFTYDCTLQK